MPATKTKLPRCYKCGQVIRKQEYLDDGESARHIVCPLTPAQHELARAGGLEPPKHYKH
jgi:hypothetical protein